MAFPENPIIIGEEYVRVSQTLLKAPNICPLLLPNIQPDERAQGLKLRFSGAFEVLCNHMTKCASQ